MGSYVEASWHVGIYSMNQVDWVMEMVCGPLRGAKGSESLQ